MHVTARSYLTCGIAALGAGAIALSPIQPLPDHIAPAQQRAVADLAVSLAATVDPIQAVRNLVDNTGANLKILGDFYMQNPFPLAKTVGANLQTYAKEIADGQAGLIPGQIWGNIQTFFNAPYDPGATQTILMPGAGSPGPVVMPWFLPTDTGLPTTSETQPYRADLEPGQGTIAPMELLLAGIQLVAGLSSNAQFAGGFDKLPPESQALWTTLVDNNDLILLTATPASGQLLGLLGTAIAPLVQLTRSFTAIGAAFQAGKAMDALYELINIPANMTNAFLNGLDAPLDLTGVLSGFLPIPEGYRLGLQIGGLLNTMPMNGSNADPENPPTEYSTGTLFNSISIIDDPSGFFVDQNPYGLKNGWGGSVVGLGQYLSEQLLVVPPEPPTVTPPAAVAAAATAAPAPAAAVSAPAVEASPAVVDAPAAVEAPPAPGVEAPAPVEAPAAGLAELDAAVEAPAPAAAETPAPARRGGAARGDDNSGSDNGGRAGGTRGHRGAAN